MAADDLFFQRTGEETRAFVQVCLKRGPNRLDGVATMSGPMTSGSDDALEITGDLPSVLREAQEYAMLNGLDLRIALDGNTWPTHLGILGNVDQAGGQPAS